MTCAAKVYRRRLRRSLRCPRRTRQELMQSFEKVLQPYLEENESPDMARLTADFGPPERMAKTMLEGISSRERRRYRRDRWWTLLLGSLLGALALALLLALAYDRGREAGDAQEEFTEVTVYREDGEAETFAVPNGGKLIIRPDGSVEPAGPAEDSLEEPQ